MASRIETIYAFSPEVLAAYLEVINLIWAYQHEHAQKLSPFHLPEGVQAGSALQRRQYAISLAYLTTHTQDGQLSELRGLLLNDIVGFDTLVAVLEVVPTLWKPDTSSNEQLVRLSEFYIDICHQSACKEVQAQAMHNLAEVLDRLLIQEAGDALCPPLLKLWSALPLMAMNPAFANAVTRASGAIVATLSRGQDMGDVDLSNWGLLVTEAGLEDKVYNRKTYLW